MKYSESNKPLYCPMTQSTWYRGTRTQTPVGVLWHSTGANNPTLKRYVQPDDNAPDKQYWLDLLGKNQYGNDWNHINRDAGVNFWIGKLADGTVTSVQVGPLNYRAWGCGAGSKGSCNNGWTQFEICEDALTNEEYFNEVYQEALEITAYICKTYNIDPHGKSNCGSTSVPNITCHIESYNYGCGSDHSDVLHWFSKFGKTMEDVRNDVEKLLKEGTESVEVKTYELVIDCPVYETSNDAVNKQNKVGTYSKGTYYIYNKYPNGYNGVYNITKDDTGNSAGAWINPSENIEVSIDPEPETIKTGDLVKVKSGAVWYDDGSSVPNWVYASNWYVKSISGTRAVIDKSEDGSNSINSPIDIKYLELVKESTTTPEEPSKPETPEKIEYNTKTLIVEIPSISEELIVKVIKGIKKQYSNFDTNIAKAFFNIGPVYGIYPLYAISQSILETGWFKFQGSSVSPEQHNYCGLGATGGGVAGASFDTIEQGVEAQYQHLYAYGCTKALPKGVTLYDPRYNLVSRGAALTWEELTGKWAVPGYDTSTYPTIEDMMKVSTIENPLCYGHKILNIAKRLLATEVTQEEIDEFYGRNEDPEVPVDPEPEQPLEPVEPDIPDEPLDPIEPEEPQTPVEPETPDQPTEPIEPENPEEPDDNNDVPDFEDDLKGDNWFVALLKIIWNFIKSLFRIR